MHFVLWGLHQLIVAACDESSSHCFNALRALGSSSTLNDGDVNGDGMFQCTSCFGVFINLAMIRPRRIH